MRNMRANPYSDYEDEYDSENLSYGDESNSDYEDDVLDEAEQLVDACDDVEIDGYVQFIKDMQQYPLFTKAEEAEKFRALKAAKRGTKEYQKIREEIFSANLRLVISVVSGEFKNHATTVMSFQDMIQEGTFGLSKALDKFDVEQGYKFSTYATPWIRQSIQRAIADHGMAYRLSPGKHTKMKRVMAIRNRMENELGRLPSIKELAEESGIKATEVEELINIATPAYSIDMTFNANGSGQPVNENEMNLASKIADESTSRIEDDFMGRENGKRILDIAKKCLNQTAYTIFVARHLYDKPETFESIGLRLGYSREYVRKVDSLSMNVIRYIYQKGHMPPHKGKGTRKND